MSTTSTNQLSPYTSLLIRHALADLSEAMEEAATEAIDPQLAIQFGEAIHVVEKLTRHCGPSALVMDRHARECDDREYRREQNYDGLEARCG